MSGIEPESERLVPRTSTSVVNRYLSLNEPQLTKDFTKLTTETQKPLFHTISGVFCAALRLYVAQFSHRSKVEDGGRDPDYEGQALFHSLMRRVGE